MAPKSRGEQPPAEEANAIVDKLAEGISRNGGAVNIAALWGGVAQVVALRQAAELVPPQEQ